MTAAAAGEQAHPPALEMVNVVMRYRPGLPPALRGVSLTVPVGHKLGVCGRTGVWGGCVSMHWLHGRVWGEGGSWGGGACACALLVFWEVLCREVPLPPQKIQAKHLHTGQLLTRKPHCCCCWQLQHRCQVGCAVGAAAAGRVAAIRALCLRPNTNNTIQVCPAATAATPPSCPENKQHTCMCRCGQELPAVCPPASAPH